MASLNKMQLIGNLGADPEIRYMPDGSPTASVTVTPTVVFFKGLAEVVRDYLKKGSQIYVEGKLRTRKWTDKEGIDRYTTEIIGQEMQMLGKKPLAETQSAQHANTPPDEPGDDNYPF